MTETLPVTERHPSGLVRLGDLQGWWRLHGRACGTCRGRLWKVLPGPGGKGQRLVCNVCVRGAPLRVVRLPEV